MIPLFSSLSGKFLGQGKRVEQFERALSFLGENLITVNSGTSALELAYDLLDLKKGDEVISPVFTAVATNIPLIRRGVKIIFADVTDKFLMDFDHVQSLITPRTKAIVNAHLFGLYNKAPQFSVPIIGDACQYLAKTEEERFTAYSFQATKIITTADGGALVCKYKEDYERAKLLRWYGIDRETGKNNIDVDIQEAGYKFHMNDVNASMGLSVIPLLSQLQQHRLKIQAIYKEFFQREGGSPFLIFVKDREGIIRRLKRKGIEAGLVHRRNDYYTVFGGKRNLLNMDRLENHYLFLPCHNNMNIEDATKICNLFDKSDLL